MARIYTNRWSKRKYPITSFSRDSQPFCNRDPRPKFFIQIEGKGFFKVYILPILLITVLTIKAVAHLKYVKSRFVSVDPQKWLSLFQIKMQPSSVSERSFENKKVGKHSLTGSQYF